MSETASSFDSDVRVATPGPPSSSERNSVVLVDVLTIAFGILAPLVGYFVVDKGSRSWASAQIRETLNFSITLFIAFIVLLVLEMTVVLAIPAMIAMFVIWVVALVSLVKGAIRAKGGLDYRFPFTLRLIS